MRKLNYWVLPLAAAALLGFAGAGCTAKQKAAYHLHRAEKSFNAGQYASAEIEYKKALRNAPRNAEAWTRLGLIYFDEGRLLEAYPILSRAKELAPTNLAVRVKLGELDLGFGRLSDARMEADYVLANKPQDDQAPILLANAVAPKEIPATRKRLQMMQQKGDSAPLEVALGTLAFRQRDFKTAEAAFQHATTLDPKFSSAYTALGNLFLAQKDLKRAEPVLKTAAEVAPSWSGAGVRYARFKIMTGDLAAGKTLLQDITKKTPEYLPAWVALAQLAAAQTNYAGALTLLNNVLSRDPQNYEGLMFKGRWELLQGKTNQAVTSFEESAKIYPKAPVVRYLLAGAYLANNQTNQAYDSVNQALKLNPQYADALLLLGRMQLHDGNAAAAIVTLKKLAQEQPHAVPAWLLLADAYRAQGTLNSADQIYQQLEKSYPTNALLPLLRGGVLAQQQQNADARRELERALQLAPNSLPALLQLVNLDLADKQYADARQRVEQKLKKFPNAAPLHLVLGQVLAAQGQTNQAEAALSKAIELQPDSQAAYLLLAQLYVNSGQSQKALAKLQTALDKDPKDGGALMLMGMIYDTAQDHAKAINAYEKLVAIAPNNAVALNNLACDYADHLGQLDKALPLARQAHIAAPAAPAVADTLGWILCRKGQYDLALPLLRDSAAKLSASPAVQYHFGVACYIAGNEADAKAAFQRALQLPGNFPNKNECNQYLSILNLDAEKASPEQRAWLEKWITRNPDDPVALARLAVIYQRAGTTDKAISAYETILKASPQDVTALVNLARLYAPTDATKALAYAKSAYQVMPNNPEVTHVLGRLAFQTGDFSWALTLLQLTVQAQPKNPDAQFELGEAFYSQGKVPDARKAMQNALSAGAASAQADDAKRFLAMTALADAPAQALAQQAQIAGILKADPSYVPALVARAAIEEQKSDSAAAEQTYETVLKRYPDFAPAQKQLAMLYVKDPKNDAKAYPLALKARQAFPKDLAVAATLGMIVYRQGDYARAVTLLQEPARQKNPAPEWPYYLGMAQYRLKHKAESKAALQQALNLHLSGPLADEARRILAELK